MPFLEDAPSLPEPIRQPQDPITGIEPEGPGIGATIGAAARLDNTVGAVVRALSQGADAVEDPEHNPLNVLEPDSVYVRDHLDRFAGSLNAQDTERIKQRIDQELKDRAVLEASGGAGIAAGLAAGFLDPINLLPGATIVRGARGVNLLKSAGQSAAAGAGAGVATEAILQGSQETRSAQESAINIAGATILSGALGGAVSGLSRTEFDGLIPRVDGDLTLPDESDVFVAGNLPTGVGAAALRNDGALPKTVTGNRQADRVLAQLGPVTRLEFGQSEVGRRTVAELAESATVRETAQEGVAQSRLGSAETRAKLWRAPLSESIEDVDQLWKEHWFGGSGPAVGAKIRAEIAARTGSAGNRLTYSRFKEEVAIALRNGDEHSIPEVAQAAKVMRSKVYDPLKDRAIELGLLPEGVTPETAISYLNRVYNKEKIIAQRGEFKRIVDEWFGRSFDDLDPAEISDLSDEIIDRILGTADGRLPYDIFKDTFSRGPLKERTFNIPDNVIQDFLENDVEYVARTYVRTMSIDTELADLAKSRGYENLDQYVTGTSEELRTEYNRLIQNAKSETERKALERQKQSALNDIGGIIARLQSKYDVDNAQGVLARSSRVLRSLNYLRLLGGMTVSAIPDLARTVMVHGAGRTLTDGLVPMIRNFRAYRASADEIKAAGTALDMMDDTRAMAIADIMDNYGRGSKFERGLQGLSSNFGIVSLMAPWNAALKQFAGTVTLSRMFQNAETLASGGTLPKREIEALARVGIDRDLAERMAAEFKKHGKIEDGVYLPNSNAWTDKEALIALRGAITREVDKIIVTPGQEVPLFMSTELGKLIGQFKSFALSSTQRTLMAGLQQRDLYALNGALMAMALGGLSYAIKQKLRGAEPSDNPREFLAEAFDHSGLAGWFMEANNLSAKLTRGAVSISGKPMSRYASRNIVASALGPSVGLVEDFSRITGDAFAGEFSERDIRALRRLMPYQNVFYIRELLNEFENGINRSVGFKEQN